MKKQYTIKMVLIMTTFFGMSGATFAEDVPVHNKKGYDFCWGPPNNPKTPQVQAAEVCPEVCKWRGWTGHFKCHMGGSYCNCASSPPTPYTIP